MIDAEMLSWLRCPATGQALSLDDAAETTRQVNDALAAGRLAPASGQPAQGPVEGVLRSADGRMVYPVYAGVPSLLPDSALVAGQGSQTPRVDPSARERAIQQQQMAQYSAVYERWTGGEQGITRALQRQLHARYRDLFTGASVLDVGNGGTPPETQLGAELAQVVKRFIALDKSPDMLRRSGVFGDLLHGDAFDLPFQSDAVDVVMVNNTIHHFGLRRGEDDVAKLGEFLNEALRVSRKGVVGVELLVPPLAEWVERLLMRAVGFMPTFVHSASFYRRAFSQLDLRVTDFEVRRLGQLTSPWKIIPPILDFTWLRVPTFMVPYSFAFFAIEK